MNKPDKSSIFKTSLLVALLGSVFGAQAAGLGKLTVYSAIGQPLNAEVGLSATAEELGGLSAKLASHEAFQDAGIEFMPALTGLRMNVGKSPAGQPVLRLTTDAPLNEPFLHFLVELNWTAGRMVREYTFLLDPPEMLQAARPASVVAPSAPAAKTIESAPASRPVVAVVAPRVSAPVRDAGEVRVKTGDTLNRIAREHKPEAVSLDQMLVALFNGNRDAFIGDNMNRLRAGKILKLPDEGTVARVDQGEARRMIVSQAADFNAYRRRLAEAASAAPAPAVEPQQSASGRIKPQIEQKTPPSPKTDKLEVSRTESAKQATGIDKARLEEELVSRDKALREASERIAQLEKNLESLKRLAELKSQAGAQVQQQAQAAAATPAAVEQKKPEAPVPAPAEAPKATEAAPASVAAAPKPAAPPAPKPEVKKPAPPPPPPPEPDFMAENPELVFGGGGLIALLLGYLGFNAWRRKKQTQVQEVPLPETPSFLAEPEPAKVADSGSVVSLPEPADDVSILGDFSQGALTTEESADPVAEADVLMAYGRDGQAEEILLEGLKSDPGRSAIHLKLMELYANRKDAAKFEAAAQDLHALNRGQGPEWERAAALARDLGVAGALFAHAAAPGAVESAPEAEAVAESVMEAEPARAGEVQAAPAVAESETQAAPPEDEAASLDFDLDLGTTSMPAAIAAAESAAQQAKPVEEAMSLDFDFDLGTPSIPEPPPAAAESVEAVSPDEAVMPAGDVAAVDSNAIDFSLDGDVAEELAAIAEEASTPEAQADAAAGYEVDFDLGLDLDAEAVEGAVAIDAVVEPEAEPEVAIEPAGVSVQAMTDAAGEGLDFDLGTDEAVATTDGSASLAAEAPAIEDFGLSEISLDLDAPVDQPETATAKVAEPGLALPEIELPAAAPADVGLPALDLDLDVDIPVADESEAVALPEVDLALEAAAEPAVSAADMADDPEVATKLELAQAYEEMGDREGARELLNEVLNEGSPAQQALARTRLDQLDV
ncbi:MAG: FimV/HubP family polar landmark protein [Rhodocyclaceae bacterium]|nr:FimV/HubP family polar landmark protein [Rhodocyclaceae bacterium]